MLPGLKTLTGAGIMTVTLKPERHELQTLNDNRTAQQTKSFDVPVIVNGDRLKLSLVH